MSGKRKASRKSLKKMRRIFSTFFILGLDKAGKGWFFISAFCLHKFVLQKRNQGQNSLKQFKLSFIMKNTSTPPPANRRALSALGAFLVAATLLAAVPLEQARAQLFLDIFPSNDNTNQTLWVFSGSTSGWTHSNANPHIRTSGGYDRRDTSKTSSALFQTGTTTTSGSNHALTPLFTATATNAPLDLQYMTVWAGNTIDWGTTNTNDDIAIPSNVTNTPTISYAGRGSRTIANMYLRDVPNTDRDDFGPRTSSQLNYDNQSRTVTWYGAATMAKPISHFPVTTPGSYIGNRQANAGGILGSWVGSGQNNVRIRVHAMIPEPQEYALVFALFALGFVFFHRRMQRKQRQQAATTS